VFSGKYTPGIFCDGMVIWIHEAHESTVLDPVDVLGQVRKFNFYG